MGHGVSLEIDNSAKSSAFEPEGTKDRIGKTKVKNQRDLLGNNPVKLPLIERILKYLIFMYQNLCQKHQTVIKTELFLSLPQTLLLISQERR
jgi:hypothetical protein